MNGRISDGWTWVLLVYGITWVTLLVYALSLWIRTRLWSTRSEGRPR
jgi:hypothetical protein